MNHPQLSSSLLSSMTTTFLYFDLLAFLFTLVSFSSSAESSHCSSSDSCFPITSRILSPYFCVFNLPIIFSNCKQHRGKRTAIKARKKHMIKE
ncbi:hypothetical protein Hanom_Chr03g00256041 [Helianthus anomalus]